METDPVSERSCFYSQKDLSMENVQNPSLSMKYPAITNSSENAGGEIHENFDVLQNRCKVEEGEKGKISLWKMPVVLYLRRLCSICLHSDYR
jgi:hypothetical protein